MQLHKFVQSFDLTLAGYIYKSSKSLNVLQLKTRLFTVSFQFF